MSVLVCSCIITVPCKYHLAVFGSVTFTMCQTVGQCYNAAWIQIITGPLKIPAPPGAP
uniref:Uncharacterized protein n=1 Tax=Anguilla anguilla TaxID=7936 RepID=A0A0E9TFA9_ANGAN